MVISHGALAFVLATAGLFDVPPMSGETSDRLPAPTGAYSVGRVTLVCEDSSRIEPLDPSANARRILEMSGTPPNHPSPKTARGESISMSPHSNARSAMIV